MARERRISSFSAAAVYDALAASGVIEARAGVGYFVRPRPGVAQPHAAAVELAADSVWERRRDAGGRSFKVDAGCGWLPGSWLYSEGIRAALRSIARSSQLQLAGYGNPLGFHPLRMQLRATLQARGIEAQEDQIVLTQGASQALDLIVRTCLKPGDVAIVEDPGYPPIVELLKQHRVRVLAVPRTGHGPDVDALSRILARRRAHYLFTNTTCQNPTGTTTSPASVHRLLELADRHGLLIIEDEIFAELDPRTGATLASLDSLRRVIYVSSFSKTLSPSLRCGYLVTSPERAQQLARAKVTSSLGSSELLEQAVLQVLAHGHYRRHLNRLRERLSDAHLRAARAFEERGVELAFRPQTGLFLWARLRSRQSVSKVWQLALQQGVLLAPGELFRVDGRATAYWRFNVAQCTSAELLRFLDGLQTGRS